MSKKKYQAVTIPKLMWDKKDLTATRGVVSAQPLEPGFGITLGNALRRVLLGGVEGSCVTSVIIEGVNNEFSSLDGVREDVLHILLNIKSIVIQNETGEPGKMSLDISGESTVRASAITSDEHLSVVNMDHVIAHVAANGHLKIDFFVEPGRGYQPAQWPIGHTFDEEGRVYLDAMFSPVKKVTFDVEKTRVGRDIDFDKLLLTIETNGAQSPLEVLHYSVSVLRTQLEHFLLLAEIPFNDLSKAEVGEDDDQEVPSKELASLKGIPVELLLKPIEELELSVRANNCLIKAGIKRVIDLVNLTDDQVLKIKNFGRKSLNEVIESLQSFGLSFGMGIKEDDINKYLEHKEKDLSYETSIR